MVLAGGVRRAALVAALPAATGGVGGALTLLALSGHVAVVLLPVAVVLLLVPVVLLRVAAGSLRVVLLERTVVVRVPARPAPIRAVPHARTTGRAAANHRSQVRAKASARVSVEARGKDSRRAGQPARTGSVLEQRRAPLRRRGHARPGAASRAGGRRLPWRGHPGATGPEIRSCRTTSPERSSIVTCAATCPL